WACDSLLSRLTCFSMSRLGFHCASMLRLTDPTPIESLARGARFLQLASARRDLRERSRCVRFGGFVLGTPGDIEPGSALVPGPFWCATGLRPAERHGCAGHQRCPK